MQPEPSRQNHKPTLIGLTQPISEKQNDSLLAEEFIGKLARKETSISLLLSFHSIRHLFVDFFHLNPSSPIHTLKHQIRTSIDRRIQSTLN